MSLIIKYLVIAAALLALPAGAQEKLNIFIATGPTAGVYYPMGGGLADILTKYVPSLNATAGTTRLHRKFATDAKQKGRHSIFDGGRGLGCL